MKKRTFSNSALLTCSLLLVLLHCAMLAFVGQAIFASVQPNAKMRLLPPQEWEFSELDADNPNSIGSVKKYGFIEVSTIHPRFIY